MFFKGNDVSVSLPIGYGKSLLYQAAPVIDRLSSLEESGHNISCASVKALTGDYVHYILMYLGQEECPPLRMQLG